ncbi:hypothetical protein BC332_27330 [Capsicum chinense]|nr:hypothetical protein BC332_27330 [Capsicum chinense]
MTTLKCILSEEKRSTHFDPRLLKRTFDNTGWNAANSMKRSKDPFEEPDDSLPESPGGTEENEGQDQGAVGVDVHRGGDVNTDSREQPSTSKGTSVVVGTAGPISKPNEEDKEEEEENMDVQLGKLSSSSDPDKLAKMQ